MKKIVLISALCVVMGVPAIVMAGDCTSCGCGCASKKEASVCEDSKSCGEKAKGKGKKCDKSRKSKGVETSKEAAPACAK